MKRLIVLHRFIVITLSICQPQANRARTHTHIDDDISYFGVAFSVYRINAYTHMSCTHTTYASLNVCVYAPWAVFCNFLICLCCVSLPCALCSARVSSDTVRTQKRG